MDFNQLTRFYDELIVLENKVLLRSLNEDKKRLNEMFSSLLEKSSFEKNRVEELGLNFNLFSIMRYGNYETRLHTPFLVNLFDPKGSHGLGDFFFMSLIEHIYIEPLKNIKDIEVFEEVNDFSLDGRIDILIRFTSCGLKHEIAIENKLDASDQPKQLERYYNYLNREENKINKLVYLTKLGVIPTDFTISTELYNTLVKENVLSRLSYKHDVSKWIEMAIDRKPSKILIGTLVQYYHLIKSY